MLIRNGQSNGITAQAKAGINKIMIVRFLKYLLLSLLVVATPTLASVCSPATSAGTAPTSWQTYCWFDFSTYDDVAARSASGQNFSIALNDGSTFAFNVKVTSTAATGLVAVAAPSWSGSAVGNTAFLGIPGKPIMYGANNASTVTVTFSSIVLTPPSGATAASTYMFVAGDGESTNNGESLQFVTNGGNWTLLDQVPPISGNIYPTTSGTGTQTFLETGAAGTVGGYIVGTQSPTTVTATIVNGGLQGAMFAVRFASVTLNTSLVSVRPNATDQFTYSINVTSSGTALTTATSSGAGNGPYGSIAVSLASGLPFTVKEVMAAGSTSTLLAYSTSLTCTNTNTGSSTALPTNNLATNYNFPSLAFGDAISCNFVNTPFPILKLSKVLGATGRVFTNDQFIMNIKDSTSAVVATTTTTGAGTTISTGTTAAYQARVGNVYSFSEAASGTTILNGYAQSMACVNAFSTSSTTLPTLAGGTVTPALGDSVTCTITNTATATTAKLQITKNSSVVSDPINGTTNPRAIPGAVVQYTITITNIGKSTVDVGTVVITDPLPTTVMMKVSGTPVTFTDGTVSSGLTFSNANVTYTKAAGGNSAYTYTPVADANGYDTLVTGIKLNPTGTMAAATSGGALPSFTLQFLTKIR